MVKWTDAQLDAIYYSENKDVLVAAAAGSGKTAVLVERIIQKIISTENPVSVDELLVLTFTDPAAREMKSKIAAAVDKKLKEQPDNKHLKQQSLRVHSADISTIHSFAKKIIENNIHLTDIPAGFTVVESAENEFLLDETLNSCLEKYYSNIDRVRPFKELAAGYGGIKNDNTLREQILRLHKFSMSMAQPAKWLNHAADMYREVSEKGTISGTAWGDVYLSCVHKHAQHILGYYEIMNEIAGKTFLEDDKLTVFVKSETEMIKKALFTKTLDEFFDYISGLKFERRPTVRSDDPIISAAVKSIADIRDTAKKKFTEPRFMRYTSDEEAAETIKKLYPRIKTLKNIVLMLIRGHRKLKRKNSYLDFNDLEHELIKLLMNSDGTPTEFCKTLGEKYKEILVDEYQDTNDIQDTIFRLLSGGRGNIFMVGDIKQSIYGFRNASPGLFLEKYKRFGNGDSDGHLIRLSNNFRSRAAVVDSVNFVFRRIMRETVADIEYTEDEYLNQSAVYEGAEDESIYKTEMLMTDVLEPTSEGETRQKAAKTVPNSLELEAETIAKRIQKLVYEEKLPVTDKESGEQRPIKLSDIVILCRTTKNIAPVLESVFYKYKIPLVTDIQSGFLDSVEVRTVISFLEIIDNPLQDIPLVAVLRSPIFGFTADELAEIRAEKRRGCFYDALCVAADTGDKKSADFIKVLNDLRDKSAYMGVDELIHIICRELDYEAAAAAMPGGEQRRANLRLLLDRASNFERTSLKGLFSFVNYLERVSDTNSDLSQGKTSGADAVSLVTIHKSKGLEYPVVILANTYSAVPDNSTFVYHADLGIGMNFVDIGTRIKYECPTINLIKYLNSKEKTAEEVRVLYVALTRAKEKLIISCTNTGRERQWLKPYLTKDGIAKVFVEGTDKLRDWLVFAYLSHRDAEGLRDMMESDLSEVVPSADGGGFGFELVKSAADTETEPCADIPDEIEKSERDVSDRQADISEFKKQAEDILGYRYPFEELTKIPLKLTVSEIKERLSNFTDEEGYTPQHSSIADRSFKEAMRSKAAETGTITHFVLQHIDPRFTDTPEIVREQIMKMTASGMISEAQAKNVDANLIAALFETELGNKIKKAAEANTLYREFKFLIPVDAGEIYGGGLSEKIIVQGVVDCFFIENDEIVLADYKTDNCTAENAARQAEKYRVQADFYARGLSEIFGKNVKEKIIFFLKPQVSVRF